MVGNARAYGVRDGSGVVYVALITPEATAPSEETIHLVEEYIKTQRPVGAKPLSAQQKRGGYHPGHCGAAGRNRNRRDTDQVQKAISEYLSEVAFSGQEERYLIITGLA